MIMTPVKYLLSIATALSMAAPVALAQNTQSDLEEIVVIGQGIGSLRLNASNGAGGRLGLSSFNTPASVDVITKEEIATKGDYGILEAVTRSAGISSSANPGNGGTSISSRGFTAHNATMVTYDGTRLYVTAGTVTFPADTWTLERVEILRGAGSVINGIGALGVTINYVPKAPEFGESNFDAVVAAGSFGMNRIALGGGAELSDNWAYRLDASRSNEDGYVDRTDETRNVFAGSLLFQPSSDFRMKFSVDYADLDTEPYFGTPLINGEASDSHRQNNYNYGDGLADYEDLWARVRTEWDLTPNVTFRNDTFFLDVRREWQNLEEYAYNAGTDQIDRAFYLGIIHDQEQLGTRGDFLIESDWGGKANRLTVGAEINSIDLNYFDNFATGGFGVSDSVPVFGFIPGTLPIATIPTVLDYTTDTTQYAFFFDDVLQVTEQLSLVLGGRFDDIDYDRFDHPIGATPSSAFDAGFSEFTWRAGIVYQPSDALSYYAQASTAADPVTSPISISSGNQNFDLSTGRQYEIGLKQQILDGRGEYTIAYFDIVKEDLLTRLPGSAITEQIGQQSSDGFEFTFRVNPTDTLSIDLNAAFINAQYDEFFSGGVSLAGNTPRNVPETTANLWVNWAPLNQLQVGAGLRYVDSRFGNDANTQTLPSYTVFDASLNWSVSDTTEVILRARNLTDEKDYILSQYTSDQWVFGDPRAYELSVRFSL
ncbi:MAG: TonB-dependent siderophore receptor [Gemmatimonadetes bacterium]|nr:TonB-dependent siderophore receptor [Gemmatimonadota bacterium]MCZ6862544.1 TonB-dependent siderophore receptor [Alphaproteobacteria bacterium]